MSAARAARSTAARRAALVLTCLLGGGVLTAAVTPEPGPEGEGAAEGVTVSGARLHRDGEPWLPRGFNMIGLLTPSWCARSTGVTARGMYGPQELAAAAEWGADTLRFQVSQRGLADPARSAVERAAYLQHVLDGVAQARTAGFAVVVSMQDQAYGCGDVHPLPSAGTVAAWSALAPPLAADPGVLLELFNEPRNVDDPAGWAQWRDGGSSPDANLGDPAVGHQALVDHVRGLGNRNVLIADTARLGERSTGLPLLEDPLGAMAYGIHPYYYVRGEPWWDEHYGDLAARAPVLATEWNHLADECRTDAERLAPELLDYLRRHGIGVLAHAFDIPGTTVADRAWTPTACGTARGGSGALTRQFFAALPGTDTTGPAIPAGVRVASTTATGASLAWDAATDAVRYEVRRDGVLVAEPTEPALEVAGLRPSTTTTWTVRAVDDAGNVSPGSPPLGVTTLDGTADTTAPSAPATVDSRVLGPSSVRLVWSAAIDDVGVTGYRVLRDGTPVATVPGRTWTDPAAPVGLRRYTVIALDAAGNPSAGTDAAADVPAAAPTGLTGTYFDTAGFTAQRLTRVDRPVDFSWGTGRPAPGVGSDTFSVRWTGRVLLPADGRWVFAVTSDEGVRLWIDDRLVVDDWSAHRSREAQGSIVLGDDRAHTVRIEYYDRSGPATVRLAWSGPGTTRQVVPAAALLSR